MNKGLLLLGSGLLFMTLAWQHIQATKIGYELEDSRKLILQLRSEIALGRLQCDKILSPASLALKARQELGMVPAAPGALRLMSADPGPRSKTG